jgi:hypothetical protein
MEKFRAVGTIAGRDDDECQGHFDEEKRSEPAESVGKPTCPALEVRQYLTFSIFSNGHTPVSWEK